MDRAELDETIKEMSKFYKQHIFDDDQKVCQGYAEIIRNLKELNGQAK